MNKLKIIALSIIISLSMTACSTYSQDKLDDKQENTNIVVTDNYDVMDKGPVKGGVLKLFSTNPDTMNPILTNNTYVQDFLGLVFEGMVALGRDQKPLPSLADRWEVSPDGMIWTFHIRENVVWHNNMPVTAEDIKFTIETIQNSKVNSIYKNNCQNIALFTAVDRNTFRIFLKKPDSFTPERMTFPIVPKHYYLQDDITVLASAKNMQPIGTGPYKFVKSDSSNMIKLVQNEKWWKLKDYADTEKKDVPYIGEIDVKLYKSSKDEINALQSNDIDMAFVKSGDFGKYSGRPDLAIRKFTNKNYDFITFNMENPILSDKVVRQAMAYAVDRIGIVNDLLAGQAIAAEIPVMPNTWLYDTSIISYGYDKAKAKEMLMQNGWKEDEKGLYKAIKGVNRYLNVELIVNDLNNTRIKVAEKISSQLKEIGINLSIRKVKWEDELNILKSKKFDMALLGCRITSVPDISFAYSSLESAGGMNISGYKNPIVDNYLEKVNSEIDENKKKTTFTSMKEIIMDDMPYLGLYFYNNAVLFSKRVKGEISPCVWNKYYDIENWYIATGLQKN